METTNKQDNSIINSLKRLERSGSESSRATEKLIKACKTVASAISDNNDFPSYRRMPRDYMIVEKGGDRYPVARFLTILGSDIDEYGRPCIAAYLDGLGSYLYNDFTMWIDAPTRQAALQFAADIADGLLDEIADWLEARKSESESATEALESSAKLSRD